MPRNANQSKSFNYSFTGAGQVDIASPAEVGITSSYSWWMNRNSATANTAYFYNVVGTAAYGMFFLNSSLIYLRYGGNFIVLSSTELTNAILQINVWQNWTITRKEVSATAQDIKLYVDGVKVVEVLNTTGLGTLGSSVKQVFGAGSIIKMLDFSVFDYVLSDGAISVGGTATGQVAELYNSGNPINPMALPSPPIAYYPLGTSAWNGQYLAENNAIGDYVFDFNGSSDYIDINSLDSSILNSSFSTSIWLKKEEKSGVHDNDRLIDLTVDSNTSLQITTDEATSKFAVNFKLSGVSKINQQVFNSFTSTANEWNQIVLTWDGTSYVYYFNGQPVASTGSTGVGIAGTGFFIGKRADGNSTTFFKGQISNTQIFNSALSATEVETLYNYGSPIRTLANIPQSSSLKAWYKLDASEIYNSTTTEWSIDNNQNPSAYPSSLDFDAASSDYIQIPYNINLTPQNGNFTISAWINTDNLSGWHPIWCTQNLSSSTIPLVALHTYGNKVRATVGGSTNNPSYSGGWALLLDSTESLTTSTWYHITVSYNMSGNAQIYINAVTAKRPTNSWSA